MARNLFDASGQDPDSIEIVEESALGQTDAIIVAGPELPTVEELIEAESDPEILANLVIIRDTMNNEEDAIPTDLQRHWAHVMEHRRAQHPILRKPENK